MIYIDWLQSYLRGSNNKQKALQFSKPVSQLTENQAPMSLLAPYLLCTLTYPVPCKNSSNKPAFILSGIASEVWQSDTKYDDIGNNHHEDG